MPSPQRAMAFSFCTKKTTVGVVGSKKAFAMPSPAAAESLPCVRGGGKNLFDF